MNSYGCSSDGHVPCVWQVPQVIELSSGARDLLLMITSQFIGWVQSSYPHPQTIDILELAMEKAYGIPEGWVVE